MMLTCWIELLYSRNEEHLKQKEKKNGGGQSERFNLGSNGHQKDGAWDGGTQGKREPSPDMMHLS